jgi:RluA family pseudouridine synthase
MVRIEVGAEQDGMRLDRLLRKRLPLKSLSEIYRLVRKGSVRVDGRRRRESYRVREGEVIETPVAPAEAIRPDTAATEALAGLTDTSFFRRNFLPLFEDETLLVCNKPAGLVVHPGSGHLHHDTLVELATAHLMREAHGEPVEEPALVHRLDRDTSGVILIAKSKQLLRRLHAALRERTMEKEYTALCHGHPPKRRDSIELHLSRTHQRNSGTKVRVDRAGQAAGMSYRVTKQAGPVSVIRVHLHTGRTHQIRVMMAHLGCPVVGDVRYGDPERDRVIPRPPTTVRRLYLHARSVAFYYPPLERVVRFEAPVPAEFDTLIANVSR